MKLTYRIKFRRPVYAKSGRLLAKKGSTGFLVGHVSAKPVNYVAVKRKGKWVSFKARKRHHYVIDDFRFYTACVLVACAPMLVHFFKAIKNRQQQKSNKGA